MAQQTVADVMTPAPTTIGMSETLGTAARTMAAQDVGALVELMRVAAVRRIPVTDGDTAVGIVSIGDLALQRDPASTPADISAADPDD